LKDIEIAQNLFVPFLPVDIELGRSMISEFFRCHEFRPLPEFALLGLNLFRRRDHDKFDHRLAVLGDDDLLALRCVFDKLRKVGLGFVEIDLARHGRTLPELVKLVK